MGRRKEDGQRSGIFRTHLSLTAPISPPTFAGRVSRPYPGEGRRIIRRRRLKAFYLSPGTILFTSCRSNPLIYTYLNFRAHLTTHVLIYPPRLLTNWTFISSGRKVGLAELEAQPKLFFLARLGLRRWIKIELMTTHSKNAAVYSAIILRVLDDRAQSDCNRSSKNKNRVTQRSYQLAQGGMRLHNRTGRVPRMTSTFSSNDPIAQSNHLMMVP